MNAPALARYGRVRFDLEPAAGPICGLVAGACYLTAQLLFAAMLHGGVGWEPLQRIAAILLGPDAAPPPSEMHPTIAGIALIIHGGLSLVFGCIVAAAVRAAPAWRHALGALIGIAIYGVNYWLLAPLAFPWFQDAAGWTTIVDHVLFGVVAAAVASACIHRQKLTT
jgi:hypothetical protein